MSSGRNVEPGCRHYVGDAVLRVQPAPCSTDRVRVIDAESVEFSHPIRHSGPFSIAEVLAEISSRYEKSPDVQGFFHGETRTRTGDTTIFSRVLYQLSYLAVMGGSG